MRRDACTGMTSRWSVLATKLTYSLPISSPSFFFPCEHNDATTEMTRNYGAQVAPIPPFFPYRKILRGIKEAEGTFAAHHHYHHHHLPPGRRLCAPAPSATMPPCHHATIPPCHHATMPPCHHATIPPYHHTTIPPYHNATMPPFILHHCQMNARDPWVCAFSQEGACTVLSPLVSVHQAL